MGNTAQRGRCSSMVSMEQVRKREKSLLDRILTMKPTPRVDRLKEVFLCTEPVIEIDCDRIYTRVMKETDGESMVIRRAKAFTTSTSGLTVRLRDTA